MKRLTIFLGVIFLISCSSTTPLLKAEIAPDYMNERVGIQIDLPEGWKVFKSREEAPVFIQNLLPENIGPDGPLLFLGINANSQAFVRCLVEKVDMDIEKYAELLYFVTKEQIDVSSARLSKERDTVQLIYSTKATPMKYTYLESVTRQDSYMIRVSFWTLSQLFEKYEMEFRQATNIFQFLQNEQWQSRWIDLDSTLAKENLHFVQVKETPTEDADTKNPCSNGEYSMLWSVEHGKSVVYLFGSIHLGKPEFYPLAPVIEEAFESSQHIVVEINSKSEGFQSELNDKIATMGMLKNGQKLSDVLSKPIYDKLVERLNKIGLPVDGFLTFKPWLISMALSTLQMQAMGYLPDYGVEMYFLEKAQNRKTVLELESIDEQLQLFERLDGELYLAYSLLSLNTLEAEAKKLINAWRCGDDKVLEGILNSDYSAYLPGVKAIQEAMFHERNKRMTDKISQYLQEGSSYFVVLGAGHLFGEDGIVNLLTKRGYTPKRM